MTSTATLVTRADDPSDPDWWRQAVVYQIYPRSFADSNGDGVGDLQGIISRVQYLTSLGIDAVWLSPFYPSALADGGYDVDDYRDVDPRLGTLSDFDELVAALHGAGIKLIVDIVPNHTSNLHEWFQEALAVAQGLGRARPLHLPRRHGGRRQRAAVGLGLGVRRIGLGADAGRAVVPASVRGRAAGPQLEQPRGPRRLPDHAEVLVGPWRRRVPGGRGACAGQGPDRAAAVEDARCRGSRSRMARTRCGIARRCTRSTPSGARC